MSDHECIGLHYCVDHPRWVVARMHGLWFAYAPYAVLNPRYFRTWREAYDFAYTYATGAALIRERNDRRALPRV